ncbi:hypothetical protein PMAYCL1PPCAC_21099, partial [Pristionchus mayeri]
TDSSVMVHSRSHRISMIRLLIFAVAIVSITQAAVCSKGYKLMNDRCIKLMGTVTGTLSELLKEKENECEQDGGFLPIIKTVQDNTDFNNIVQMFDGLQDPYLVLGMVCNATTTRLEWEDSSTITYIQQNPKNTDIKLDYNCVTDTSRVVSRVSVNDWIIVYEPTFADYKYTFLCETKQAQEGSDNDQCGEYEYMPVAEDANKPCVKINTVPLNWQDAEAECRRQSGHLTSISSDLENVFIRRMAVGANVNANLLIGATKHDGTRDDTGFTEFTWIDGADFIYNNFDPKGEQLGVDETCSSMIINGGKWMIEDCDKAKLPYACRREKIPAIVRCNNFPRSDTYFLPPGFPNSKYNCSYYLTVDTRLFVDLQVEQLDLDEGDYLDIFEGYGVTDPAALIASINSTSILPANRSFITRETNQMTVIWTPKSTSTGKGFELKYQASNEPGQEDQK